jgi:hypothetical protein
MQAQPTCTHCCCCHIGFRVVLQTHDSTTQTTTHFHSLQLWRLLLAHDTENLPLGSSRLLCVAWPLFPAATAPLGFTTGGRSCGGSQQQQQQQSHWGQSLHYLDIIAEVQPGRCALLGSGSACRQDDSETAPLKPDTAPLAREVPSTSVMLPVGDVAYIILAGHGLTGQTVPRDPACFQLIEPHNTYCTK